MITLEPYIRYYNECVPEYTKLIEWLDAASYINKSEDNINFKPLVVLPISSWTSRMKYCRLYIKAFEYALDKLSYAEQIIIKEYYLNKRALKELVGRAVTDSYSTNHFSKRTIYRRKQDAELHFIEQLDHYNLFAI